MSPDQLYKLIDGEARAMERAKSGDARQEDYVRIWNSHIELIQKAAAEAGVPLSEFCVSATDEGPDHTWSRMYCDEGMEEFTSIVVREPVLHSVH